MTGVSEQRLKQMSPRELRRFLAGRWDTPLAGTKLTRLRTRLLEDWSCAGVLSSQQRRVLVLRAGLFGRTPATLRAVARRAGVPLPRAVRLVRFGLARLSRSGNCIEAGGAALGTSVYPQVPGSEASAGTAASPSTPEGKRDDVHVLGAFESHETPRLGLVAKGHGGPANTLLAFLTVLLALASAVALATRRGYLPVVLPAKDFERSAKPLLFLDVDGVVTVKPVPGVAPRGHWHQLGFVQAYVSEGAGERIRALSHRYEIIWATGWGEGANTYFRPLLGLQADFPVLTFGAGATSLSVDWKVKAVDRAAAGRPVAWVDDHIGRRHERWARRRRTPTQLVRTNPYTGISDDDVRLLLDWADELGAPKGGRFAREQGTAPAAARR